MDTHMNMHTNFPPRINFKKPQSGFLSGGGGGAFAPPWLWLAPPWLWLAPPWEF